MAQKLLSSPNTLPMHWYFWYLWEPCNNWGWKGCLRLNNPPRATAGSFYSHIIKVHDLSVGQSELGPRMAQVRTILRFSTEKSSFFRGIKGRPPVLSIFIWISTQFQQPLLILKLNPGFISHSENFYICFSSPSVLFSSVILFTFFSRVFHKRPPASPDGEGGAACSHRYLMSIFTQMTLRSTSLLPICLLSFSLAFPSLCWQPFVQILI